MCMIDRDDDDWTVLRDTHQRARKEHRCGECGRTIAAGDTYRRHVAVERGYGPSSARLCAHCDAASSWLMHHCGGFMFGGIREDMAEHDEGPDDGYRLMAINGIRAKWNDGQMPVPDMLVSEVA